MTLRWLLVLMVPVVLSGCKNDRQCWIDYTAEVSFCNSAYLDCWSSAETQYDTNACYHDTHASCISEAREVLNECADDDECLGGYLLCEDGCETWDTVCRRTCEKGLLECTSEGTCSWKVEEDEALFAADDDDSAAGDDDDSAAGDDDDDAAQDDPLAEDGIWECTDESWYDPTCEATCNETVNVCYEVASCREFYNPLKDETCTDPLDLDDRADFLFYIGQLQACEEARRACTMCCYGVECQDDYTCDMFGLE